MSSRWGEGDIEDWKREERGKGEKEERRDLRALKRRQKEEDDRNLTCIEFRGSCMSDNPWHHHCFIQLSQPITQKLGENISQLLVLFK